MTFGDDIGAGAGVADKCSRVVLTVSNVTQLGFGIKAATSSERNGRVMNSEKETVRPNCALVPSAGRLTDPRYSDLTAVVSCHDRG